MNTVQWQNIDVYLIQETWLEGTNEPTGRLKLMATLASSTETRKSHAQEEEEELELHYQREGNMHGPKQEVANNLALGTSLIALDL
jgi:hypothetical protein